MQRPEHVVMLGLATAFSPLLEIGGANAGHLVFHWLTVLAIVLLAVSTQFTAAHRLLYVTRSLLTALRALRRLLCRERLPLAAALLGLSLALEFRRSCGCWWPARPALCGGDGCRLYSG